MKKILFNIIYQKRTYISLGYYKKSKKFEIHIKIRTQSTSMSLFWWFNNLTLLRNEEKKISIISFDNLSLGKFFQMSQEVDIEAYGSNSKTLWIQLQDLKICYPSLSDLFKWFFVHRIRSWCMIFVETALHETRRRFTHNKPSCNLELWMIDETTRVNNKLS